MEPNAQCFVLVVCIGGDCQIKALFKLLHKNSLSRHVLLIRSPVASADFAQLQHRQYERQIKQMEPDMAAYEKQKRELGEDFYPGVNTLLHGGEGGVSEAGMERMAADLEKQWVLQSTAEL